MLIRVRENIKENKIFCFTLGSGGLCVSEEDNCFELKKKTLLLCNKKKSPYTMLSNIPLIIDKQTEKKFIAL